MTLVNLLLQFAIGLKHNARHLAASPKRSSAIATAIFSLYSNVGSLKCMISLLQLALISAALSGSFTLPGTAIRSAMSFRTYLCPNPKLSFVDKGRAGQVG